MKPHRPIVCIVAVVVVGAVFAAAATRAAAVEYPAEVVPKDFVALCAPVNSLRLPFWGSDSNGIQLVTIEPEGTTVAAGDVVATFRFRSDEARGHLVRRRSQLLAERDEALMQLRRRVDELELQRSRLSLTCAKLDLDLVTRDRLPAIKQRLLEYDKEASELERQALDRKLAAARRELEWATRYHASTIKAWDVYFDVFDTTKARYTVHAPVAGALHYPVLEKQNRKIVKGDQLNSGVHFLSVVRSQRAEVRFFVPESRAATIAVGAEVEVVMATGPVRRAQVTQVAMVPINVGDARRNYLLPDAWDRCFVVAADITSSFTTAVGDVKVRVPPCD